MHNTKAYIVESLSVAAAQHVCFSCARQITGDDTWVSGHSYWHTGEPCDRCSRPIGGSVGQVIRWNRIRRSLNERNRRFNIHQRFHEEQCCFDDDDCVAGRFWVTE